MTKLPELTTDLSNEFKKPISDRNYELINTLQQSIQEQKAILHQGFKKSRKENHDAEVKLKVSFYKKKNDRYGKIRKAKLEAQKEEREKSQPKRKVKK